MVYAVLTVTRAQSYRGGETRKQHVGVDIRGV